MSELELATRAGNALAMRIKAAGFPVIKELADFDFTLVPQLSKPRVLELARGEWIGQASSIAMSAGKPRVPGRSAGAERTSTNYFK